MNPEQRLSATCALSDWVDAHLADRSPEARLLHRTGKIHEEIGEFAAELHGNEPLSSAALMELCDVVGTALTARASFDRSMPVLVFVPAFGARQPQELLCRLTVAAGEVFRLVTAVLGANPRKPRTGTMDDVGRALELVASLAMAGLAAAGLDPMAELDASLERVARRAGLRLPPAT